MFGLGSIVYATASIAGAFTLGVWYGKKDPAAGVFESLRKLADDAMALAQRRGKETGGAAVASATEAS